MSKTIRRKNSHEIKRELRDYDFHVSKYGGEFIVRTQAEGEERKRRLARYHSDAHFGWSAPKYEREVTHAAHRAKAKTEIVKYYKDKDYEIQIRQNPRWPYWD